MEFLGVVLSLILPAYMGKLVLDTFFVKGPIFTGQTKVCVAFGLGLGLITLVMLWLSIFGIPFLLPILILVLCAIQQIMLLFRSRRSSVARSEHSKGCGCEILPKEKIDAVSGILLFIIGTLILWIFFRTWIIENDGWDSWSVWAFKAKIFYYHRIVPLDLLPVLNTAFGNWDYPQHVPLTEAWFLLWRGYWDEQVPRIIFPIFYSGICLTTFYFLRPLVTLRSALIGVFFVASLRGLQMSTVATYAEPVLLFYYCMSFALLCCWMRTQGQGLLLLSAIFSGLAAWTKNEGLLFSLGNLFVLQCFLCFEQGGRKRLMDKQVWKYLAVILVIILPWAIIAKMFGLQNAFVNKDSLQLSYLLSQVQNLSGVGEIFKDLFFNLKRWNLLWVLAVIAVVCDLRKPSERINRYILLSIVLQFGACIFLCLIYPGSQMFISQAAPRLLLAPTILAAWYIVLVFGASPRRQG